MRIEARCMIVGARRTAVAIDQRQAERSRCVRSA